MRVNCRPLLLLGALGLAQASAQGLLVLREEDAQPQQSTGLMAYLQEQYERSSAMLQSLMESTLRDSNPSGGVQIVILEEEDESDDTLDATDRRLACETALRQLHEQDAAKQDHKSRLHSSLRHALHFMTSFRSIDQASCDDLDRDVLREEVLNGCLCDDDGLMLLVCCSSYCLLLVHSRTREREGDARILCAWRLG